MVSQRSGMCLKSFLEPVRFVGIEYELTPSHGDPLKPNNYQFHAFPDHKVKCFESRMSSWTRRRSSSSIFFLYKKKICFLYKKKIFFLYKKKIFFLCKKKIF